MLSKLKYTGVSTSDLLEIYSLFIRSRAEYMSVVWHSSLTILEANKIENIQKTSLKIILGESYDDYFSSLAKTGLKSLSERRKIRCLSFAKRCLENPHTKEMFPLNSENVSNSRQPEKYSVNFARTENYLNSAVPYCQRLLNDDHKQEQEKRRERQEQEKGRERQEQAGHQRREGALARREG